MKILLTLILACAPMFAQDAPRKEDTLLPPPVQRLLKVQYLEGSNFSHTIDLLRAFGVTIHGDPNLRVLAVNGPKAQVDAVEEALKRIDVPPPPPPPNRPQPNIEVTMFIVLGSTKPDSGAKLPGDLEAVAKQLRGVFTYQNYRLLDTQVMRVRNGNQAEASGVLMDPASPPRSYNVLFRARLGDDTKGHTAGLDNFKFWTRRTNATFNDASISTDVDVREGQRVVVGKSSYDPDSAIFLIVTARIVD